MITNNFKERICAQQVRSFFVGTFLMAKDTISDERLTAIKNEIIMAEKFNDEELRPVMEEAVHRYIGHWRPQFGADWDIVLNEVYPIVQNHLPSISFKNPRAFFKPRNKTYIAKRRDPVSGKMVDVQLDSQLSAKTQEHILNYQLTQIGYKNETRKTLLDALLFPFGVMWRGYKGDFGMTEESSMFIKNDQLFIQRLSPLRYIKDPAVSYTEQHTGGWVGRTIDMRLDDILEDDKLDVDKKSLKGFDGFGEVIGTNSALKKSNSKDITSIPGGSELGHPLLHFAEDRFKNSSASKFVKVQEIFVRPTKKERRKGIDGWILLLTDEQEKPLRVNKWKIKAEGFPSILLEFNPVNDRMFGIPDVQTYASIADQKNIITNLQIRNAQENTKVWVGINKAEGDEEDIQKVQDGTNTIILFEGDTPANQRMFVASPGSPSSDLYALTPIIQRNLDEKSGVTDLRKGILQSGEESKFSVQQRSAGSSARPAYRQDIMADFHKANYLYLNQLERQFTTIKEAVRIIGSRDLEWSENPSKEELQADIDVEIDAISMLAENPQQELKEFQTALAMLVDGIRDPQLSQKLQQEGKTVTISPLIDQILTRLKINDPDVLRNIKPEESEGFVSVSEIRAARKNVEAALSGQTKVPSPPEQGQDHRARIEVYSTILNLIKEQGETIASQILSNLLQVQSALLAEIESKQANVGQPTQLRSASITPARSV